MKGGLLILKERTKCCGDRRAVWIPKYNAYCCPCLETKIKFESSTTAGEVIYAKSGTELD